MLDLSDIAVEDLEQEMYGPNIVKTQGKQSREKSQIDDLRPDIKVLRFDRKMFFFTLS